jgi:hypothetical protein
MESGIRKFAMVIYAGLCVYLFAQLSPHRLENRAEFLDKQLSGRDRAATVRALSKALDLPATEVERFLETTNAKPSDLVFAHFLKQHGVDCAGGSPRDVLPKAEIPRSEVVSFLEGVDQVIAASILPASNKVEVVANPRRNLSDKALAQSLRSQPD